MINSKKKNKNKQKQKTKKQLGGVKIGKGSFGCVVYPSIPCNNEKNKNTISKIILNVKPEDYKEEMDILKYLRSIDTDNKYLISIVDECKLDKKAALNRPMKDIIRVKYNKMITSENSMESSKFEIKDSKFNSFQSYNSKKNIEDKYCLIDPKQQAEYRNQIQVYGGKRIKPILKLSSPQYKNDYDLIKSNYKSVIKHFLKGCKLMHDNYFVHRDIKFENMVYSNHNNIPIFRYIDFNLGELFNTDNYDILYRGTPGYVPIDFYLFNSMNKYRRHNKLNLLKDSKIKKKVLNHVINKYIEQINIMVTSFKSTNNSQNNEQITIKTVKSKKQFKFKKPRGKQPKLPYLRVTDKNLNSFYDIFLKILFKGEKDIKVFYTKQYDGMVYKTDIYALGIVIGMMYKFLKLKDKLLFDLIVKMTKKDSRKRLNINQCLNHKFFKN
jgi:serine/threonine protein kinase